MMRLSPIETYERHVTFRYIRHLLSSANLFTLNDTSIKASIISDLLYFCGCSEDVTSWTIRLFYRMNLQVWDIQDILTHFSSIGRLFSNRVPPHPISSLCALVTSFMCLPVMLSDFPKLVRAQICLRTLET